MVDKTTLTMEFDNNKPIYLQIADYVCDKVLTGDWQAGGRIPSVRELGADLQVNPNTVVRTYDYLQSENVIFNKRGIGYFVADDAVHNIVKLNRSEFFSHQLPSLFKTMNALGISFDELKTEYDRLGKE
jgi:DNA-binding transcriptional regulator YhcF (GntR family)